MVWNFLKNHYSSDKTSVFFTRRVLDLTDLPIFFLLMSFGIYWALSRGSARFIVAAVSNLLVYLFWRFTISKNGHRWQRQIQTNVFFQSMALIGFIVFLSWAVNNFESSIFIQENNVGGIWGTMIIKNVLLNVLFDGLWLIKIRSDDKIGKTSLDAFEE